MFRTIISSSLIMAMAIWISNQTIGLHTQLAQSVGKVAEGASVASLDQGGCPITYLITQGLDMTNFMGFAVIGVIYVVCVIYTAIWSRRQYKEWAEELGEDEV